MPINRKIVDALVDFETHRKEQKLRVGKMRQTLDVMRAEFLTEHHAASANYCAMLRDELRIKTMRVESLLLKLSDECRTDKEARMTTSALLEIMEAIHSIESTLCCESEIHLRAARERKLKLRLHRAQELSLGYQALLQDMLARVTADKVQRATMELVARLHEVAIILPRLERGYSRKHIDDYKIALKNIGAFIRFVKKAHALFCRVYKE